MTKDLNNIILILKHTNQYEEGDKDSPYNSVFKDLWPIISHLIGKYAHDEDIIENICTVIKYSMRILDKFFEPFIMDLIKLIVSNYKVSIFNPIILKANPFGSYVYIIEIMVTVFVKYPQCKSFLSDVFNGIC